MINNDITLAGISANKNTKCGTKCDDSTAESLVLTTEFKDYSYKWKPDANKDTTYDIVLDGIHPESGMRVHVVKGDVSPRIVCNALVIGINYASSLMNGRKFTKNYH